MNIWKLIEENDLNSIKSLLEKEKNKIRNEKNQTLLQFACLKKAKKETIKIIISHTENINAKNNQERTALHFALIKNLDLESIELLINSGSDINIEDCQLKTPLDYSITKKSPIEIISLLILKGANINHFNANQETAFAIEVRTNCRQEIMEFLLENGAFINTENLFGRTPLHNAIISRKSPQSIKFLLSKGANINIRDYSNNIPLFYSFNYKKYRKEIIQLLVNSDTNLNHQDSFSKNTCLHNSILYSSKRITNLLIEKGANMNIQNKELKSPLHLELENKKRFSVVKLLVDSGADLNILDELGFSPLQTAIKNDVPIQIIKFLLQKGADPNFYSERTLRPLHFLLHKQLNKKIWDEDYVVEVFQLLMGFGADLDFEDIFSNNILHLASQTQFGKIIKILVEKMGSKLLNSKNRWGRTPLHSAMYAKHPFEIIQLLTSEEMKKSPNDFGPSFLSYAIEYETRDVIEYFYDMGAALVRDPSKYHDPLFHFVSRNYEPVLYNKLFPGVSREELFSVACEYEQTIPLAESLIDDGFDVNYENEKHMTLAHFICMNKTSVKLLEFVISKGIDLNKKDIYGETALHYLMGGKKGNSNDFIGLLVKSGVDIESKNNQGETPLHLGCGFSGTEKENILELIRHGADVNCVTSRGMTPLHLAISYNRDVIPILLENGADIKIANLNHELPFHFACQFFFKKKEIERFYFPEIDVNAKTTLLTPLMYATIIPSNLEVFQYLVSKGADVNSPDNVYYSGNLITKLIQKSDPSPKLIRFLVECGIKTDFVDMNNNTLLHLICAFSQIPFEILQIIINSSEIDINAINNKGFSALGNALNGTEPKVVEFLLQKGANLSGVHLDGLSSQMKLVISNYFGLSNDLWKLYTRGEFSDLQIIHSKNTFKLNSLILVIRLYDFDPKTDETTTDLDPKKSTKISSILSRFTANIKLENEEKALQIIKFLYSGYTDLEKYSLDEKILVKFFHKRMNFDLDWIKKKSGKSGLLSDLEKLFNHQASKDFCINSNGKQFFIHKLILIARSRLFRGMFLSVTEDKSNQVSEYHNLSLKALQEMIRFFYLDNFDPTISNEILDELKTASDFYQIRQQDNFDYQIEKIFNSKFRIKKK
ncbi:ankyrin repeat-containing protein [Anaeramoeba ignava]|uniref:Ankyrin repeat-containing protein n=1 Tax=Anaeramoeba ignava TaxID=1746090 RepID=A0A9Q0RGC6_ANAIG|nr:ankyrin repeat-containing protein [Anaeramoeba ignava]